MPRDHGRREKEHPPSGLAIFLGVLAGAAVFAAGVFAGVAGAEERSGERDSSGSKKPLGSECPICLEHFDSGRHAAYAFSCGHVSCKNCMQQLATCHACRKPIQSRTRLYVD